MKIMTEHTDALPVPLPNGNRNCSNWLPKICF